MSKRRDAHTPIHLTVANIGEVTLVKSTASNSIEISGNIFIIRTVICKSCSPWEALPNEGLVVITIGSEENVCRRWVPKLHA